MLDKHIGLLCSETYHAIASRSLSRPTAASESKGRISDYIEAMRSDYRGRNFCSRPSNQLFLLYPESQNIMSTTPPQNKKSLHKGGMSPPYEWGFNWLA